MLTHCIFESQYLAELVIREIDKFKLNVLFCQKGQEEQEKKKLLSQLREMGKSTSIDSSVALIAGLGANPQLRSFDKGLAELMASKSYPIVLFLTREDFIELSKSSPITAKNCRLFQ